VQPADVQPGDESRGASEAVTHVGQAKGLYARDGPPK